MASKKRARSKATGKKPKKTGAKRRSTPAPKDNAPPAGRRGVFDAGSLDRSVIAIPLLEMLQEEGGLERSFEVIIDLNLEYPEGRRAARKAVLQAADDHGIEVDWDELKGEFSQQYLFGKLTGDAIRRLVTESGRGTETGPIYRVWPDFDVNAFINRSVRTVKADAARTAFSALGDDITWAVLDSGIDAEHGHFLRFRNLEGSLAHRDFTRSYSSHERALSAQNAVKDDFGHGTHVAGIIAGQFRERRSEETNGDASTTRSRRIRARVKTRSESGKVVHKELEGVHELSGMAPKCGLLSLKVLDDKGRGKASNLIAAIEYVQELNGFGRHLRVHGVNLSVGYDFKPEWFACGQSPLCVEVDRLARSGVVVVVAAGNTGYGLTQTIQNEVRPAGMDLTINDPGNAELAITVGSTHRDMPHIYGVSYFSSKGPTGDGRPKPDLVAPGEKIVSCATGKRLKDAGPNDDPEVVEYIEDSGTSMAAPHVSGVIAAFLSIRREFIGRTTTIKEIFMASATDLKRADSFQGKGLVDLMRAIQSV